MCLFYENLNNLLGNGQSSFKTLGKNGQLLMETAEIYLIHLKSLTSEELISFML